MDTKEDQPPSQPTSLIVAKNSIKSRSSNCLMDPTNGPWLPGLNLTTQPHSATNEWPNLGESSRPSRDDGGSSQSNSNFEQWKVASDKQRLKGSRRKKRGGKQQKNAGNVEGGKEEDQLSPLGRKIIVFVAVSLFLLCILLVGVTLRLGPVIDEMVRKGNEEIYRSMSAGASTSSPTTEGTVVANNTATPSSGTPG